MITDELRQLLKATPFRPFRLYLADGRQIDIPHPEYVHVLRNMPIAIVEKDEGRNEWVNLPIITSFEALPQTPAA